MRGALPEGATYPHYLIVFNKQTGVFVRSGTRAAYPFDAKDLPPRTPRVASPTPDPRTPRLRSAPARAMLPA